MMTPKLKQDIDALMIFTAEQAKHLHNPHGVEMGAIKIDIIYDEEVEQCEDCDCELAEEAAPTIQSLDDVQSVVTELFASFTEGVAEAQEELKEGLELLTEEANQAGLSAEAVGMLVMLQGVTAGQQVQELFEV